MERLLAINGTRLWTATAGESPSRRMILCHGGPGGYDDMESLAAGLSDLATVHRYDQRGCGRSDRTPPYTVATYLADLEALREHWGYRSWVVAGHSWGAGLALAYALAYPDRVDGLVYISGTGLGSAWHAEYRVNRLARLTAAEQERWHYLREQLKSSQALAPAEVAALDREYTQLYRSTDWADRRNLPPLPEQAPPANHEVNSLLNAEWAEYLAGLDRRRLAQLTVPTLVVHGQQDPRPAWAAREVAEALPNAQFTLLEGVGHYPYLEEPHLLLAPIRPFLDGLQA